MRVRIDDDCPAGQAYRVAETARGGRGVSYSYLPTKVTVDAWHQRGSSADLVTQVAGVRDSINLVTGVVR